MAYCTESYYKTEYFGRDVGTDFNRLALRASDAIDIRCGGAIDTSSLNATQLSFLQKACAAQIEYYFLNGEQFNESGVASENIGNYSYSGSGKTKSQTALAPMCEQYLLIAGLMYAGARVSGAVYYE